MTRDDQRIEVSGKMRREMLQAARDFRKDPTPGEAILWQALRGKQLNGIKFRRQQPIGPFVVDFYASAPRLVVEVDGTVHENQQDADHARQMILEDLGLNVIRFSTEQVETDLPSVLAEIALAATPTPPPAPSPTSGEGEKNIRETSPLRLWERGRGRGSV